MEKKILFYLTVLILIAHYSRLSTCNTISTSLSPDILEFSEDNALSGSNCENDFADDFCDLLVESQSCDESSVNEGSAYRDGCKKACGLCSENEETPSRIEVLEYHYQSVDYLGIVQSERDVDDSLNKCEDKLPDCSKYLSVCCSMKEAMNASCPKTCRFCSDTTSPGVPGGVGGGPAPTGSTNQDPCGGTNPPSVTVDAPGAGTTTTTLAPVTITLTAATLPAAVVQENEELNEIIVDADQLY